MAEASQIHTFAGCDSDAGCLVSIEAISAGLPSGCTCHACSAHGRWTRIPKCTSSAVFLGECSLSLLPMALKCFQFPGILLSFREEASQASDCFRIRVRAQSMPQGTSLVSLSTIRPARMASSGRSLAHSGPPFTLLFRISSRRSGLADVTWIAPLLQGSGPNDSSVPKQRIFIMCRQYVQTH